MSPAPINPGRHARPLRPGETCRPCRVCGVTRCSRKKVNFVARRAAGSTGSGDVDRMASKTVTVQFKLRSAPSGSPLSLSTSRRPLPTLILPSGRVDGHLAQRGHETTGLATRGTDGYCEPEFSGGHRINDRRARGDKASVAQARDGRGVLQARRAPTGAGSNDARPSAKGSNPRRPLTRRLHWTASTGSLLNATKLSPGLQGSPRRTLPQDRLILC